MTTKPLALDSAVQAEIIQSLSDKLKSYYVFPETAAEICERLQEHMDAGDYNGIRDGEQFAAALTAHLQEVNQDKHLGVKFYPHPLPGQEAAMHDNQEWVAEWRIVAQNENYGLYKAERLPGNVGYLDIRAFSRTAWAGDTAAAAMIFLVNTSALIVDLRKCRGGDPDMVALISTYLFGEERVHLNSLYWRESDVTEQYWTLPYVPGKRYGDKPVYVLTSKETFSGGEEFAYNLKTRQRGTLVGETTGGGAHPGAIYRLHPHFDAFIPNGRAINPVSGTNWEGTGVAPDVPVPQEQAFTSAYRMALESLLEDLQEAETRPAALQKEEVQQALKDLQGT